MPEFNAGEAKTAVVEMTNPTPAPFGYQATLYMGVNMVALYTKEFALDAGESENVRFPITMPLEAGAYPVYFDVWSGATLLGHYQATEDVIITGGGEVMLHSLSFPVAPCYRGRTTLEAILYIPPAACPEGSSLLIEIAIPKECGLLPLYYPANPDLGVYYDAVFLSVTVTRTDLTSPNNLYVVTAKKDLATKRYRSSPSPQSYDDWIPVNTYPLYLRALVDPGYFKPPFEEQIGSIIISPDVLSSFTYSNANTWKVPEGERVRVYFEILVTNSGAVTETRDVRLYIGSQGDGVDWYTNNVYPVTLLPGQSYKIERNILTMVGKGRTFQFVDDQGSMSSKYTVST